MNRYQFTDLLAAAVTTPTNETTNALGEWCERYGSSLWNGECFDVSAADEPTGTRSLYPIYTHDDDPIRIGWELK